MNLPVPLRHFGDRQRRANAGHDVFALRVDQELAVELVLARGRIARERDACARVIAHIAEHHRLAIHSRPEQAGDVFNLPIGHRPRLHPTS